ncbi:helix-turn-helix domain-containing protein [Candidatus Thiodictyon syntrophicum]|jgi:transcriptional regulator with XRE-family HTH domain|uniref:Transcriptional regulator n=1 Tax=Candidatus Thiodictyon syntrophicum TaxID=1166950 RepID=A0A2K8UD76_9GAMM|nr:helix-turn-helix domain-containing protein [Candidatus Thiodictyon syntrophicum]AUB83516.1 transcriptional regulator [Candidatus Thiodictyon syntrophicum]
MKNLQDLMNALPPERRAKVEERATALIAEEMTLRDLRKARDLTQERVAELLGMGQDSISRLENRADMLLSTLRSYVDAMGGSLELLVRFPDRPTVSLSELFGTGRTAAGGESPAPAKRKRRPVRPQ